VTVWLVLALGGLLTFGMRFSLIYLFGRIEIPRALQRALHYVPPAVLSAIIFPDLFYTERGLDLSLTNPRLIAGAIAIVVAWFGKRTLLTIVVGLLAMLALHLA